MKKRWMIYGANGYSGRLIAKRAAAQGLSPVLSGRNRQAIEELGRDLGCETRVFPLGVDTASALAGMSAVFHCAGPYAITSQPMLDACIDARAHYLDLSGELTVVERIYALHDRIEAAGITAVPAAGFDAACTEGLAALLKQRMPAARRVRIAYGCERLAVTRGTVKSTLEMATRGTLIRVDGELRTVPPGSQLEPIELRAGTRKLFLYSGCELATIARATGIGSVEIGIAGTDEQNKLFLQQAKMSGALRFKPLRRLMQRIVDATTKDPSDEDLRDLRIEIRGDAWDAGGRQLTLFLDTPLGYAITVDAALACVTRVLAGDAPKGALAPSQLLGPEGVLALPGVVLHEGKTPAAQMSASARP